jgi:hypothetical protein
MLLSEKSFIHLGRFVFYSLAWPTGNQVKHLPMGTEVASSRIEERFHFRIAVGFAL